MIVSGEDLLPSNDGNGLNDMLEIAEHFRVYIENIGMRCYIERIEKIGISAKKVRVIFHKNNYKSFLTMKVIDHKFSFKLTIRGIVMPGIKMNIKSSRLSYNRIILFINEFNPESSLRRASNVMHFLRTHAGRTPIQNESDEAGASGSGSGL